MIFFSLTNRFVHREKGKSLLSHLFFLIGQTHGCGARSQRESMYMELLFIWYRCGLYSERGFCGSGMREPDGWEEGEYDSEDKGDSIGLFSTSAVFHAISTQGELVWVLQQQHDDCHANKWPRSSRFDSTQTEIRQCFPVGLWYVS